MRSIEMLKLCTLLVIIVANEPASALNKSLPLGLQTTLQQFQLSLSAASAQANPIIEQARQVAAQMQTQLTDISNNAVADTNAQANNVLGMFGQQVGTPLLDIVSNPTAFPADCLKLTTTILDKMLLGLSGASGCIFNEIEKVQAIIRTIYTQIDGIVTALVTADKDVRVCIENLNGPPSYPRFPFCVSEAGSKVTWVVATAIPELLYAVASLYTAVYNLPPEMVACQTNNLSKVIFELGAAQIDNLRLCLQTVAEPGIVAAETALSG